MEDKKAAKIGDFLMNAIQAAAQNTYQISEIRRFRMLPSQHAIRLP
ncbi:hypothetical protein GNF85_23125 [Clostridium perfringens]